MEEEEEEEVEDGRVEEEVEEVWRRYGEGGCVEGVWRRRRRFSVQFNLLVEFFLLQTLTKCFRSFRDL